MLTATQGNLFLFPGIQEPGNWETLSDPEILRAEGVGAGEVSTLLCFNFLLYKMEGLTVLTSPVLGGLNEIRQGKCPEWHW